MLSKKIRLERRNERNKYRVKMRNAKGLPTFIVHRSERHIGGQLIDVHGNTLMYVNSCMDIFKNKFTDAAKSYNVLGAKLVGEYIGERMSDILNKINNIHIKTENVPYVHRTSGYQYHGRVKALYDGIEIGRKKHA